MKTGVTADVAKETKQGEAPVTGVKQKVEFKVTVGATTAGDVSVTFNDGTINKPVDVTVAASDTAAVVAGKIAAKLAVDSDISGAYTVTATGDTVEVEAKTPAASKIITVNVNDPNTTGVKADAAKETKQGEAPVTGVAQEVEFKVTAGATAAGDLSVTFKDGTIDKSVVVAVAANDTAAVVAGKIVAALAADSDISGAYTVTATGDTVTVKAKTAAANKTITVTVTDKK